MYMYRSGLTMNDLLDGRSISYAAKEINYTRGLLSNLLNRKSKCRKCRAVQLVERFRPGEDVLKYFEQVN